jgi:hypothetical protein
MWRIIEQVTNCVLQLGKYNEGAYALPHIHNALVSRSLYSYSLLSLLYSGTAVLYSEAGVLYSGAPILYSEILHRKLVLKLFSNY